MSRTVNSKARWRHTKRMFGRIASVMHRDARVSHSGERRNALDLAAYLERSDSQQDHRAQSMRRRAPTLSAILEITRGVGWDS